MGGGGAWTICKEKNSCTAKAQKGLCKGRHEGKNRATTFYYPGPVLIMFQNIAQLPEKIMLRA